MSRRQRTTALVLATWFGSGLVKIGRRERAGTYGSLAALPLCIWLVGMTPSLATPLYWMVVGVIWSLGLWSVPLAEEALGPRRSWQGKLKLRDQNQIVIDEVLGMLIAVAPLVWADGWLRAAGFALAFGFFRLFDIVKVPPTRYFDRMKNPAGVMLDDAVAGIYAAIPTGAFVFLVKYFS